MHRKIPLHKPMVVIGHSMGGCISRLLITDSDGDNLWQKTVGKPPAEVPLSPASRKLFYRRPRLSTPAGNRTRHLHLRTPARKRYRFQPARAHRIETHPGAGHASCGRQRNPEVCDVWRRRPAVEENPKQRGHAGTQQPLRESDQYLPSCSRDPLSCHLRGPGSRNKDRTKPVMADGVVPYWSSHMDGAQSELIIPSNHAAQQHPQGIAEVRRILRLHARG